ncbi:MAG: GGDEF domain-containing protein [Rhodoferax sp.]|jgi:diguanylate cyclase|nr:GGDEF domain-containing protein [Rhodoferax sp.]
MHTHAIPDTIAHELLAIADAAPLLVFLFDGDDRLRYANDAFRSSFALAPDAFPSWSELMTHCHTEKVGALINTPDFPTWLASARSRRGKSPYRAFEADLCDGRWVWITETLRADGWMLCIGSDITDLKASGRALRQSRDLAIRAAQTDALTGISNRPHMTAQLEQRLAQVRQRSQMCGIALIDLDEFKCINDRYGHPSGDLVLQHFARTVQQALRHEDGFGRVGGEEFLLLLPRIDTAGMEAIIRRIMALLRDASPLPAHPEFRFTFSAGLGVLLPHDTPSTAYSRVDKAMYQAKAAGRNGFRWAQA